MITSRKLDDLLFPVKLRALDLIHECKTEGIDLLVTSTYRDFEAQDKLYSQGRTLLGAVVTNAKGGQSFHNWRVAFDVVPLRNGKPVWNTIGDDAIVWKQIGSIGERLGLEWAGRWKGRLQEMAHFQYTGGLTLADLQAGKTMEATI